MNQDSHIIWHGRKLAGIVFDLDGTLTNSIQVYHDVFCDIAVQLGISMTRDELFGPMAEGLSPWDRAFPKDDPKREEKLKEYKRLARPSFEESLERVRPFSGIENVLALLHDKVIIGVKGDAWFSEKFLPVLTPVTITALLITLVLLFSFKGDVIVSNPLTILWIAIPLFIQTILIFSVAYVLAKGIKLPYKDAAPSAMIGASNHFEVAIATSVMLFGLSSGAALATVVGVLIEVPVMLMLVRVCLKTSHWFGSETEAEI